MSWSFEKDPRKAEFEVKGSNFNQKSTYSMLFNALNYKLNIKMLNTVLDPVESTVLI